MPQKANLGFASLNFSNKQVIIKNKDAVKTKMSDIGQISRIFNSNAPSNFLNNFTFVLELKKS